MQTPRSDIILSVVLPCLDEERTLGHVLTEAVQELSRLEIKGEVIVSDNGSRDRSLEIVAAAQKDSTKIPVRLAQAQTRGYGAALLSGISIARGQYIAFADADGSYTFQDLAKIWSPIQGRRGLVIGSRFRGTIKDRAMPALHRYIGSPALTLLTNLLFGLRLSDSQSGFRLFDKATFMEWKIQSSGMEFVSEMNAKASLKGTPIHEVPIDYLKDGRDRPPHLRPLRDGLRHLNTLLRLYLTQK